RLDLMLEGLAAKGRLIGHVERQVQGDDLSGANLLRRCSDAGGREKVDSAQIIILAPYPRSSFWSTGNGRELLARGKSSGIWIPRDGVCRLLHREEVFDLRQPALSRRWLIRHLGPGRHRANSTRGTVKNRD